jgi:microcystin degradation protein MlrC
MGDNVGGGSAGDGTHLARALDQARFSDAFVCLYDPSAADEARRAGVGTRLTMAVGGKTDARHGEPLKTPLTVVSHHGGQFTEPAPRHGGFGTFDQGPTTIVRTDHGLTIMLTSLRMAPFSLEQLRYCGLDPAVFRILVAKGVHAPVAAYREVCRHFIRVNTPGSTTADLSTFGYRNRRRPMFPWETETAWSEHAVSRSGRPTN